MSFIPSFNIREKLGYLVVCYNLIIKSLTMFIFTGSTLSSTAIFVYVVILLICSINDKYTIFHRHNIA